MEANNSKFSRDYKIKDIDSLKEIVQNIKSDGRKVVFTNGCFDLIHSGHVDLIEQARSYGDCLILGLNTDNSVRINKGESRPINDQRERSRILSGLNSVDYIVLFEERTPEQLIGYLQPDVHVKGGDYSPDDYKNMPEAKIVHDYGGEVRVIRLAFGKSTSNLIDKIKKIRD